MVNTTSTSASHDDSSAVEKASDAVTGAAGSLIDAVKASPLASAAIVAGVAGAGALIWANRSQIAEQAGVLGDKASEIGGKLGERASAVGGKLSDQAAALGGKISEQATALGDKVSEKFAAATGAVDQAAPSFPADVFASDPILDEQSKIGAVSY